MEGKTEQALIRYLTSTATTGDLQLLSDWIKTPANKEELESFVKDYYTISYSINDPNTDFAVQKLLTSIKKRKRFRFYNKRNFFSKYAAAIFFIVILIGSYQFRDSLFDLNLSSNPSEEIKIGTDKAVLTLADGSEIQLGEKEEFQESEYLTNGTQLEYFNSREDSNASSDVSYHYLTVPRGGKFNIVLSDGTKVWLNSESRLKYPINFKIGDSRRVELLYGEAYFDVSPAIKHQGADFRVYNNDQEIQVLGTEFNIKAYKDESTSYTTLVEGKVTLNLKDKKQILVPGEQAIYNLSKNVLATKSIDIYNETSWKDGFFSFDNKPLREIAKVLSRWYDVEFKFLNEDVQNEEFIGLLSKNQDIDEILLQIKNLGIINNYKIENNVIKIE